MLHLLAEGKHPDGIADERLSALVLSLRASAPQDTGPVPDERLPDETRFQVLLYGESFARRKLAGPWSPSAWRRHPKSACAYKPRSRITSP